MKALLLENIHPEGIQLLTEREIEVETDKGKLRVPAARFEPTNATVGTSGTPLESSTTRPRWLMRLATCFLRW